jgi:hypothetical protein
MKLINTTKARTSKETFSLVSIPNMRKSILKGMKEPLSKCSEKII